jgi:hypothetical protein
MSDYAHVSTSSTNYTGLKNAFATVNNLVDTANGAALASTPAYATLPTGASSKTFASVVPQAEIYTLANIIGSCVNTNGVGGSSSGCANLFASTATNTSGGGGGASLPDTLQAALNIAKNPAANVANIYPFSLPNAPFSPVLASQPNDFTMALNFTGGGMGGVASSSYSVSFGLAIDGTGNIWVANGHQSTVTELNNLGAPISASTVLTPSVVPGGFSGSGLDNPSGIAIDYNAANPGQENAWVGNVNGTLSKFTYTGSPVGSGFTGNGSAGPGLGVAVDGFNNVWVISGNPNASALSEFDNNGNPLLDITSDIDAPLGALAIDGSENVFVGNPGNGFVDKFNQSGSLLADSGNILSVSVGSGIVDGTGQFWVPAAGTVQLFGSNTVAGNIYNITSISNPTAISVDGADHVWIVSKGGAGGHASTANLTELTLSGSTVSPGLTGYTGVPFPPSVKTIATPVGAGIDASGNLWLVNGTSSSTVTEFVGVAAPSYTPLAAAVAANKIGQMP